MSHIELLIVVAILAATLMSILLALILYWVKESNEVDWRTIRIKFVGAPNLRLVDPVQLIAGDGPVYCLEVDNNNLLDELEVARSVKFFAEQLGYIVDEVVVEGKVIHGIAG